MLQEVSTALLAHARQVQRSKGSLTAEELRVSTAELLRALQVCIRSDCKVISGRLLTVAMQQLAALHAERSAGATALWPR